MNASRSPLNSSQGFSWGEIRPPKQLCAPHQLGHSRKRFLAGLAQIIEVAAAHDFLGRLARLVGPAIESMLPTLFQAVHQIGHPTTFRCRPGMHRERGGRFLSRRHDRIKLRQAVTAHGIHHPYKHAAGHTQQVPHATQRSSSLAASDGSCTGNKATPWKGELTRRK